MRRPSAPGVGSARRIGSDSCAGALVIQFADARRLPFRGDQAMSFRFASAALVLSFALVSLAQAAEHTGETLHLRAEGITAGGSVLVQPAAGPSAGLGSAGATLAAQPIGSSAGPTRELAAGP